VANTGSVVRYPYRSGDLKARGKAEVIVRDLPTRVAAQAARHITRDIAFSKDGPPRCSSLSGSASNERGGRGKRDAAASRVGKRSMVGDAWVNETDRAAVLVFDPEGRNRRVFASGLRNWRWVAVHR